MEASAILKMVEDELYNCVFIIDVIVRNDDSTMQAFLKHPYIGVHGQVLKTYRGKLDEETPEPSFLADPSHRLKVVSKHIISIINKSRDQLCGVTKADSLRLKKYWGYMKNNNAKNKLKI